MLDEKYFQRRIDEAFADIEVIQSLNLNTRRLIIEFLKNKIQEWDQLKEEVMDNERS